VAGVAAALSPQCGPKRSADRTDRETNPGTTPPLGEAGNDTDRLRSTQPTGAADDVASPAHRPKLRNDIDHAGYDRAGGGGVIDDGAGDNGGTRGTGGSAREEDV